MCGEMKLQAISGLRKGCEPLAYVTVPKDLTKIKSKMLFGLTKRQLVCFGSAALVGVPLFFLSKGSMGTTPAALCMILVMLPFFLFALYEKNGQTPEALLGNLIQCKFTRPKKRVYQTNNAYSALEKQAELERTVGRIASGAGKRGKGRRRLTRQERKQIEAVIRQAKGDGKNHTVQASLPFRNMHPDGLCRLDDRHFSKTIAYADVSYRLAGPDDQRDIFERLCDFYNGYDPSIGVQMTLSSSHKAGGGDLFRMAAQGDDLDGIRAEASGILQTQYERGSNGYVKSKYVTLTIEAESVQAARARFSRIEADTLNRFKVMGAAAKVLDGKERLVLLHGLLHPRGEPFAFEWDSIINQKKILQRYALDHGYKNYRFYIDDGISGTTFNRPGFQQMIADIEAGLVKRVIIKDMSRLGRDYLQVGMYTEIMFPEHDIHFIAVNDGVDSTQGDNEFTPFRNIINEWYAKDTSKKIRAVMKVKGNAGEHLTTLPPYGYMKSPDNKKLWVRDEEAAAVVYEIGLYVMDGFGPSQIARKLTERRILTPAAYYASRGRKASNIKRGLPYAWDASTVADIMDRWREYLGHTVNFKTRKKSYKSKKVIHNPESEWMIFENTHDPIWTEAIADAARAARQTRRRPTKMGEMGMFSGMMFCADCGSVMYQCRATNFRREQEYYLCAGYRKSRDFCGQTHSIRTVILEELILENLREIVSFASRSKDEFVRLVMDSDLRQRDRDLAKRKRQLADSEKRITELDAIFKRLYEDNISGKLSDERFQKLSADYEKEEQDLKVLASSLRKEVELEESKSSDVDRFLSVVERYTDIPELTPCILHEFVEKIIVHAASDPKGKNRTQEIDIYYKGIGVLEMSKVTASTEK